jgi:hypothetical protein
MSDRLAILRSMHKDLFATGRHVEALLVLERAINQYPGELSLVDDYIVASKEVIAKEHRESQTEHLESLEAFVKSRVLTAPLELVPQLVERASELRTSALAAVESRQDRQPFDTESQVWKDACAGKLALEPPQDPAVAKSRLAELERIRDSLPEETAEDVIRNLDNAIAWCRLAVSFDAARVEADRLVGAAAAIPAIERAGYLLQHADSILRPFAVEGDRLDGHRQKALDEALKRLKAESDNLTRRAREAEAKDKWESFWEQHGSAIESCRSWTAPSEADPDGSCQSHINSTRRVAQALQEVAAHVAGTTFAQKMNDAAAILNESVSKALAAQQTRYDRWAVARVRSGYEKGKKHIRIIDEEELLGDKMISSFGSIDTRLLGHEAQRCYSEVFELLFEHLDKPDEPGDFDKRGNKLYVLSRMMGAKKRTLADF